MAHLKIFTLAKQNCLLSLFTIPASAHTKTSTKLFGNAHEILLRL